MAYEVIGWVRKRPWTILAVLVFASIVYTHQLDASTRAERTKAFCAYAYQQQVDKRTDAIKDYNRIPPAARGTLVIAGITVHPRAELRDNLRGKYGNGRLPSYCPQHDWPERESVSAQ